MIHVYTDGACEPNPGPGGYAAVVLDDRGAGGEYQVVTGGESSTTNNRMELRAAIEALDSLPEASIVRVHSDSAYLVRGYTSWLPGWIRHGQLDNGKTKNPDLWYDLIRAVQRHRRVEWAWVRGHSGNRWNELADEIAVRSARAARPAREPQYDDPDPEDAFRHRFG